MKAKAKGIKVFRRGFEVDPSSSQIRPEQAEKLKKAGTPTRKIAQPSSRLKLISKEPGPVYTLNKSLVCAGRCGLTSPTKCMYVYRNSTRGRVYVCENCVDEVERTSFTNLDYCDEVKKKYRVGDDSEET